MFMFCGFYLVYFYCYSSGEATVQGQAVGASGASEGPLMSLGNQRVTGRFSSKRMVLKKQNMFGFVWK